MVIYRLFCCAKMVGGHSKNGTAAVAVVAVGSVTTKCFMNKLLLLKQMTPNHIAVLMTGVDVGIDVDVDAAAAVVVMTVLMVVVVLMTALTLVVVSCRY